LFPTGWFQKKSNEKYKIQINQKIRCFVNVDVGKWESVTIFEIASRTKSLPDGSG